MKNDSWNNIQNHDYPKKGRNKIAPVILSNSFKRFSILNDALTIKVFYLDAGGPHYWTLQTWQYSFKNWYYNFLLLLGQTPKTDQRQATWFSSSHLYKTVHCSLWPGFASWIYAKMLTATDSMHVWSLYQLCFAIRTDQLKQVKHVPYSELYPNRNRHYCISRSHPPGPLHHIVDLSIRSTSPYYASAHDRMTAIKQCQSLH